jgi:hypothetical protein
MQYVGIDWVPAESGVGVRLISTARRWGERCPRTRTGSAAGEEQGGYEKLGPDVLTCAGTGCQARGPGCRG